MTFSKASADRTRRTANSSRQEPCSLPSRVAVACMGWSGGVYVRKEWRGKTDVWRERRSASADV